jgi:hypothetical protein
VLDVSACRGYTLNPKPYTLSYKLSTQKPKSKQRAEPGPYRLWPTP